MEHLLLSRVTDLSAMAPCLKVNSSHITPSPRLPCPPFPDRNPLICLIHEPAFECARLPLTLKDLTFGGDSLSLPRGRRPLTKYRWRHCCVWFVLRFAERLPSTPPKPTFGTLILLTEHIPQEAFFILTLWRWVLGQVKLCCLAPPECLQLKGFAVEGWPSI